MSLRHRQQLLAELTEGLVKVPGDLHVEDLALDSREVRPGALFLACRGQTQHGIRFAQQAIAQGARAILIETPAPQVPQFDSDIFVAAVPNLSQHVGTIADRFFGQPSQSLTVAGITGTNGKTTCAWLLAQALTFCARPAAYSGTLGYGLAGVTTSSLSASRHTTADAVAVHRQLAQLKELGAQCVAMEVSSHALDQHRVGGVRFHTAAFTNLTHDHLDYHGSMEHYAAAKAQLFAWPTLAARIVNIDDAFGAQLAAQAGAGRLVVTSRQTNAARTGDFVFARRSLPVSGGLVMEIDSSWGAIELTVPLMGEFNIDNVLTVLAVLLAWEIPLEKAAQALAQCSAPPGRMEVFGGQQAPLAIVDYAHTPDALAKALRAARAHCRGSLRVVFGCGGDRDVGKRPEMGRIAAECADEVVITDDNPRTEDPRAIVAGVLAGINGKPAQVEHDRARAIQAALAMSQAGDAVLIAGKGHEDYQIYGAERRTFSDQAVVREALKEWQR